MRPLSPAGTPLLSFIHVRPASDDFQMALPGPPPLKPQLVRRRWYVAAYSTLLFEGSITISVAPVFSSTCRTAVQVTPPSVVL